MRWDGSWSGALKSQWLKRQTQITNTDTKSCGYLQIDFPFWFYFWAPPCWVVSWTSKATPKNLCFVRGPLSDPKAQSLPNPSFWSPVKTFYTAMSPPLSHPQREVKSYKAVPRPWASEGLFWTKKTWQQYRQSHNIQNKEKALSSPHVLWSRLIYPVIFEWKIGHFFHNTIW